VQQPQIEVGSALNALGPYLFSSLDRFIEMAPSAFAKVWDFYFRAFPYSVTLLRVGYSYLGEQTIPRAELSPARNAALWAATYTEIF
jgi:hypothetical protein